MERWKQAAARDDDAEKMSVIGAAEGEGRLSEDTPAVGMLSLDIAVSHKAP
jgi:hypothetical protein